MKNSVESAIAFARLKERLGIRNAIQRAFVTTTPESDLEVIKTTFDTLLSEFYDFEG